MLVLGIIIGYLICGIIVLICNSIDIDEDIKDIILGWWLIPIVIPINKIKNRVDKSSTPWYNKYIIKMADKKQPLTKG